jgi:hypothetical protein
MLGSILRRWGVEEPKKGSDQLPGEEDLHPEGGDPSVSKKGQGHEAHNEGAVEEDLGSSEREITSSYWDLEDEDEAFFKRPIPKIGPVEDGGMRAVDPIRPQDPLDEGVPPPRVEPKLPSEHQDAGKASFSTLEISGIPYEASVQPDRSQLGEGKRVWKAERRSPPPGGNPMQQKMRRLEERIDAEIDNPHLRRHLQTQIARAKERSLEIDAERREAERILSQVEDRIDLDIKMSRMSASVQSRLLVYEIGIGSLLLLGALLLPLISGEILQSLLPNQTAGFTNDVRLLLGTILWGGLGGVANGVIGILTHRSLDRDIDRQWALWYVTNPLMGLVLGAFIFLVVRAVFLGLFPGKDAGLPAAWVLSVISWVAGFQQNVLYDFVDRLVKRVQRRRNPR